MENAIGTLFLKDPSARTRLLVLAIISIFIALAYRYTEWFDPLKKQAIDISEPFYWVSDLPTKVDRWSDNRLMSRKRLLQENEALRTENLVLRGKLQKFSSIAAENARLQELMNATGRIEDRVLIAELIGVSPDPTRHVVVLNKGEQDGVYKGQALLDAEGLMGQVVETGLRNSRVLLITDPSHALPVQINRNGVRLIAQGVGNLYQLSLRHVSNSMDIREGDLLVSSGLGGRFPVGYPVARVAEVNIDPSKPFADIVAIPMAELNRSRYVLLVFDRPVGESDASTQ